jgi:rhamnosyl/mannosyltransferase
MTYYKGFEYLIRAIADLEGVELHLVGTGELDRMLRQLVSHLGICDRVTFHGKLTDDQLAAQYRACDCLCLPSIERTEAFGLVLLEAMNAGKAIIASNVEGSGMAWVVENGVTGMLVRPGDARSLAQALDNLRKDRGKLFIFGNNGREKFVRLFHIDRTADEISSIYSTCLAELSPSD